MGSLQFHCPSTGQVITSGIHTDADSTDADSLELVRGLSVKLFCPRCRTVHVMTAEDGRLAEGEAEHTG